MKNYSINSFSCVVIKIKNNNNNISKNDFLYFIFYIISFVFFSVIFENVEIF